MKTSACAPLPFRPILRPMVPASQPAPCARCGALSGLAVYRGESWSIEVADSLHWLHGYDGEPFAGILTDPPYSSGGQVRSDRMQSTRTKYVNSDSRTGQALPDFAGDTRDQRGFLAWSSLWMADALRCTAPGGWLLVFTDWRQLPVTTDAVQAGGWVWRGIVPWDKGPGSRPQKGRPKAQCEYIVTATAGAHEAAEDAPCLPGFYSCPTPRERVHITEKPVRLLQDMVQLVTPGALVCDPFVGSGAHGEAALREGRRFIGCEVVPGIAAIAAERLEAVCAGGVNLRDARAGQLGLVLP